MAAKKPEGMSGLSVLCNATSTCADNSGGVPFGDGGDDDFPEEEDESCPPRPPGRPREGPVIFLADSDLPLMEPVIREGEVLHLSPEDGRSFRQVRLSLYANGISIAPTDSGDTTPVISVSWSPFSLVQACRLHSVQADESQPWMRLFKVSIFHHGLTHFFATQGEKADMERARWVADVSRTLRVLTQSLFPAFSISVDPHKGASWTATRLLAGYLLLYDDLGVSRVYGELHAHCDSFAAFAAYEDDCCDVQVVHLTIDIQTGVSDHVGIDCSCFGLGDHHFSARTCAEKMLWLRAISNVKVKLRHWASNPSRTELRHYRASILEHARGLLTPVEGDVSSRGPLLPRRSSLPSAQQQPPGTPFGGPPAALAGGSACAALAQPVLPEPGGSRMTSASVMAAAAARLSQAQSQRPDKTVGACGDAVDDGLPPSLPPQEEIAKPVATLAQLVAPLGGAGVVPAAK